MNTQLQFANAWVLYMLWLVPAIAWWWHAANKRTEKNLEQFVSPVMQKKLRPASAARRLPWQIGLITSGLFLLLIAAARPQWGTREELVYQRGRDLVIALDVSRSMLANDVHPNRLQRARIDLMDLIKELKGDRAALMAFRRKAIMLCPLTTDYAYLRQSLESVSPDSAPAGETDIADAINKALDALQNDPGSHKAIILISDGEDLSGKALAAAEEAGKRNVPIFTVGIGSNSGSKIPDQDKPHSSFQYKGQDVVTKLNDKTMQDIAEATRGAYIPVGTATMTTTTLGMLYRNHLSRINAQDIEETLQRRHVERYQLFLLPSFLLMLAGAFLSRGRLAASVQPPEETLSLKQTLKQSAVIAGILLAGTTGAFAQTNVPPAPPVQSGVSTNSPAVKSKAPPGREGARVAQKLYLMGKYQEAAEAYIEASKGAADISQQDFRYNAAVALFKAEKYKEAADILKDLSNSDKTKQADRLMALGSTLYRAAPSPKEPDQQKLADRAKFLREAGESFKEASRSQPGNSQAKKNLAVVLDTLPAAEEQARIAELMARYDNVPAPSIADQMLAGQRQLITEIPPAFTNDSPSQILALEALALKQKNNADLWIPLKGKLLAALAQQQNKDPKIQQQLAAFERIVEDTRNNMKDASSALRDMDTRGYSSALSSEAAVYQFWKTIGTYQSILQEDIRRQTNSILMSTAEKETGEQHRKRITAEEDEAAALTDIFSKRFTEAVPEAGLPAPTNSPSVKDGKNQEEQKGISAEDRRRILDLAGQTAATQKSASGLITKNSVAESIPDQAKALELLKEIEKLLPKNSSNNKQDQKNDQQQNQQQDQQQKQDQQQPQEQKEQKQQNTDQQNEKQDEQKNRNEMSNEQLKKMIEKALQRENEHEARVRERNRAIPMSPIDRDW